MQKAGPLRPGSHVVYMGMDRSSMFEKQANLQKAAKGSRDITSSFEKKVHVENTGPVTVCQHDISEWLFIEIITVREFNDLFAVAPDPEPMQTKHTPDSSLTSMAHKQQQDVNPKHIHSSLQTKNLKDAPVMS